MHHRRFRFTPSWLVLGLLVVEGLLWLSNWLCWPAWHKGYAVLASIAATGTALLVMLLWFAVALLVRLRFQFSIRVLLVLTVVVALPCSWLGVEMKKAREQQRAVQAIGTGDDSVCYDFEIDASGAIIVNAQPPQPAWLQSILGVDFFCDVLEVWATTPNTLREAKSLRHVATVWLVVGGNGGDTEPITDDALEYLEGCTQIETLWLRNMQITDAGLKHFASLSNLRHLDIENTKITDTGLRHLKGLSRLESLNVRGNEITDAGLRYLKELPNLHHLSVNGTNVTEDGVKDFERVMPACEVDRESFSFL